MRAEEIIVLMIGIGGVVATLVSGVVPDVYRKWFARQGHQFKYAYYKAIHLTRRSDDSPRLYRRFIPRLNKEIDVYDEFHLVRMEIFNRDLPDYAPIDRSSGVVDLRVLHPWQEELHFSDRGAAAVEGVISPTISEASSVFFTETAYLNCFQEGNEDFGIRMQSDTKEARLIVDFSSIPGFQFLFKERPSGYVRSGDKERSAEVRQLSPGVYMLSRENLKKDEVLRIDFKVDWEKVDQLSAVRERVGP